MYTSYPHIHPQVICALEPLKDNLSTLSTSSNTITIYFNTIFIIKKE